LSLAGIIIYWTLVVLAVFAFALAVQMRVMIGTVLRQALVARAPEIDAGQANAAISWAAGRVDVPSDAEDWLSPQVSHLREEYPRPLGHLRIARRWCVVGPMLVVLLVAIGRFRLGLF